MNIYKSKISVFFIYIIISTSIYSCSDTNINNRLQKTNTNINLYLDQYPELLSPGYALYIGSDSGKKVGINQHGIYVVFNGSEYTAYDATCTYDVDNEEHIIIPNEGDLFFQCPICKSEFDIFFGGATKKPAKLPLEYYRTILNKSNRTLRIAYP